VEELYVVDVGYVGVGEPRVVREGQQVFAFTDQQPQAVWGEEKETEIAVVDNIRAHGWADFSPCNIRTIRKSESNLRRAAVVLFSCVFGVLADCLSLCSKRDGRVRVAGAPRYVSIQRRSYVSIQRVGDNSLHLGGPLAYARSYGEAERQRAGGLRGRRAIGLESEAKIPS